MVSDMTVDRTEDRLAALVEEVEQCKAEEELSYQNDSIRSDESTPQEGKVWAVKPEVKDYQDHYRNSKEQMEPFPFSLA